MALHVNKQQQQNLASVILRRDSLQHPTVQSLQDDAFCEQTTRPSNNAITRLGRDKKFHGGQEGISPREMQSRFFLNGLNESLSSPMLAEVDNTSLLTPGKNRLSMFWSIACSCSKLDKTAARTELLSTCSNYQLIASGKQDLVGLNHPSVLTLDLNSRRLENQKSEKWRRDRVRSAVERLAAVLPPVNVPVKRKRSDVATTIEGATEHIKALQEELQTLKCRKLV